jgi:hypothetical protein
MESGRKITTSLALLLVGIMLAGTASGGDLPKRKAGLWEVKAQMDGMPQGSSIQMCVDPSSDDLMQQQAQEKQKCSTTEVNTRGGKTTVHAVCQVAGSTVTMDGVYTGSFQSSYRGDLNIRYDPPINGMNKVHMIQEAQWLGPCKPGQKPGDIITPNMGNMNLNDMMKDPRMQEMMKRRSLPGQ